MLGKAPLYAEIEKVLRQRILSDYYSDSGFLPQERELAQEFKVSRNTLRNALQLLSDQQLICKVQGCGTMINRPAEQPGEYIVLHLGSSNLSSFVITILHEIDRQASQHSACTVYMPLSNFDKSELEKLQQRLAQQRNLRGMLLVGNYSSALLRKLQGLFDIPIVLIGDVWLEAERSDELPVSQVVGNDYAKMYQATSRLLEQGARRIAAIGQPRNQIWGNAFYNGYKDAFSDAGVDFQPEYYEAIDDYDNPRDLFQHDLGDYLQRIMQRQPHPDGLVFPAEYYGTVRWISEQNGIAIPDDLLLVGRATFESTSQEFPCVATSPREIIREALDLLKQEQKHPGRVRQRRVIEPTWLEAASTI